MGSYVGEGDHIPNQWKEMEAYAKAKEGWKSSGDRLRLGVSLPHTSGAHTFDVYMAQGKFDHQSDDVDGPETCVVPGLLNGPRACASSE